MNIRKKISVCLNLLIILTVIFSTVSLFIGFHFMGQSGLFEPLGLKSFKYFTVDSNILAALVSFIYLIYILNPANKSHKLSILMYVLKLAATTGVTLTMLVTVFFLAPGAEHYYDLFLNTNFFMHLLTPLLCIITFVFFEPVEKNSFLLSFTGIIPMLLYALYYIPNILLHLEGGKTSYEYDWYGFLASGVNTIWFVMPILFLVTLACSMFLWFFNKKFAD